MSSSPWQFRPIKLHAYEALHNLNRCFEATILSLNHLEQLGVFRPEYLSAFKVTIEHTRSLANDELMATLQKFEEEESLHFEDLKHAWDQQNVDPDDVFYHAQDAASRSRIRSASCKRASNASAQRRRAVEPHNLGAKACRSGMRRVPNEELRYGRAASAPKSVLRT